MKLNDHKSSGRVTNAGSSAMRAGLARDAGVISCDGGRTHKAPGSFLNRPGCDDYCHVTSLFPRYVQGHLREIHSMPRRGLTFLEVAGPTALLIRLGRGHPLLVLVNPSSRDDLPSRILVCLEPIKCMKVSLVKAAMARRPSDPWNREISRRIRSAYLQSGDRIVFGNI